MRLCLYLSGQVGLMLMVRFLTQWLISFADERSSMGDAGDVLFSASTMGALFFGFRIFDGITDPLAGLVSDRWVAKGRDRRQLLWYAFALPGIGLSLVFLPTHEMVPLLRWVFVCAGCFVFFVGYTFYGIPYWTLVWDDARDNKAEQRSRSNGLGVGLLIATGIAFVVTPMMINRLGFGRSAIVISIISTILMILPIFSAPKRPRQANQRPDMPVFSWRGLISPMTSPKFLALLALLSGAHMSLTLMTSAAPFISEWLLGGTKQDVALLLGPFLGVGLICLAFVPRVSRRWGWQRALLSACLLMGLVYALTSRLDEPMLGTPMVNAMSIFMLGGPFVAVILGVEAEAITSIGSADDPSRMSAYWGCFNFVVKGMNGLSIWIAGWLAQQISAPTTAFLNGTAAVKAMSLCAGGLLVCGVLGYLFFTRRQSS